MPAPSRRSRRSAVLGQHRQDGAQAAARLIFYHRLADAERAGDLLLRHALHSAQHEDAAGAIGQGGQRRLHAAQLVAGQRRALRARLVALDLLVDVVDRRLDRHDARAAMLAFDDVARHREQIGATVVDRSDVRDLGEAAIAFLHHILHIPHDTAAQPCPEIALMRQDLPSHPFRQSLAFRHISPLIREEARGTHFRQAARGFFGPATPRHPKGNFPPIHAIDRHQR